MIRIRHAARSVALVALAPCIGPSLAVGSAAQTAAPAMAEAQQVLVRVEVVAIDADARVMTVRGPEGLFDVVFDDRIVRIGGVRVGDSLTVAYRHAVAVEFSSGTGIRERSTAQTSSPAPGDRPAGTGAIEETIVADIEQVDLSRGLILVRGTQGKVAWLGLPDPTLLVQLKPGHRVTIRYRLAVALAFEPAGR